MLSFTEHHRYELSLLGDFVGLLLEFTEGNIFVYQQIISGGEQNYVVNQVDTRDPRAY